MLASDVLNGNINPLIRKKMRTDFNIAVNVNVGVTPEVVALLEALLPSRGMEQEKQKTTGKDTDGRTDGKRQTPAGKKDATDVIHANASPISGSTKTGSTNKAKEAERPAAVAKKNTLTTEDARDAMHRARVRFEGENYRDNTTSEGYVKYHRALTTQFKNIAAHLGASKPSELQENDIKAFIDACDNLSLLEDGSIGSSAPY